MNSKISYLFCIVLPLALLLTGCGKPKKYKCKKECETISVSGQLNRLNIGTRPINMAYKVFFMPENTTWIDFDPGIEYEVTSGTTDAQGRFSISTKVSRNELQGSSAIYIRFFPSQYFHCCKNPAVFTIASVPPGGVASFSMDIYEQTPFTLIAQKQSPTQYQQLELLYGSPTLCTYGFLGSRSMTYTNTQYDLFALINQMNVFTIKEILQDSIYHWTIDSVYVDSTTTQHTMIF